MPDLVILFNDGEIMSASSPPLRFDLPVIEAEISDLGSNCEQAILPLSAIRQIIVGDVSPAPSAEKMAGWDRAAFHFCDGQVLRAWIGPDAVLGVHGGVWPVVEPGSEELRLLAIPYTSLKGVYRLRSWDARSGADRRAEATGEPQGLEQTVRILAEREARSLGHRERHGAALLERLREESAERAPAAAPEAGPKPPVDGSEQPGDM